MSVFLNKLNYFSQNRPFGDLPDSEESELDLKLLSINEEREALERGILRPFVPAKLEGLIPSLKQILERGDDLENSWSELLAIDDAIRSYLVVAKKIIESYGNEDEAKAIRRLAIEIGKIAVPEAPKAKGLLSELYDSWNTMFPSRQDAAEEVKAKIRNQANSLISFVKGFKVHPKSDVAQQRKLQQEANRARAQDLKTPLESEKADSLLGQWIDDAPLSVNGKLLAHVLGEGFAEDSGFEGYDSSKMRSFMMEALNRRKKWADDPAPYERMIAQLEKASRFEAALTQGPEALIKTFERDLSSLKVGDTLLFQGGWIGKKMGHAIVFEMRRQENGLFAFRFYNSGCGLEYHENAVFQDQLYHLPFLDVSDIHIDQITSLPFCFALYKMNKTFPSYGEWGSVEAYEGVIGHLKGKIQRLDASHEKMTKTHSVGFCTYLSLAYWMKEFSPEIFARWEIELQTKTLYDFVKSCGAKDEATMRLIQKSSEQLARNALAAFEKGIIDQEEWDLIQEVVGRSFQPDPVSSEWVGGLQSSPFEKNVAIPKLTEFAEKRPVERRALDLLVLDKHPFNPQSFLKETYYWRERFAKSNEAKNYEVVKEAILEWIERVPFDQVGELIKVLQPKEASELIHQLSEIGKDYLFSTTMMQTSNDPDVPVPPRQFLAMIKLFTIGHAISRAFDGRGGILIPHLYQKSMDLILEGQSGSHHLFDPYLERDLLSLRNYWRDVEPIRERQELSFFGFEYIPASNISSARRQVYETEEEERKYSHRANIKWPDLAWMKKFLLKPEIQDRIALDPHLAGKPPTVQALLIMYQPGIGDSILPQAFKDLHDLSFCVDFIMASPHIDHWGEDQKKPPDREKGIFFNCEPGKVSQYVGDVNEKYTVWRKKGTIFGIGVRSLHSQIGYANGYDGDISHQEHNYALEMTQDSLAPRRAPVYGKYSQLRQIGVTEKEGKARYRTRLSARERVVEFPGEQEIIHKPKWRKTLGIQMPLQPMRELLALSAHPSLQIRETFAYYRKNPHLLEQREGQILFKKLFFEPPLLMEFAEKHPEELEKLVSEFDSFCKNGIRFYTDLGSPLVAAFYIEIGDKFHRAFPARGPIIRPADQLRDLIGRQLHTPEQELFLFLDLISMQTEEHLTEESAVDLLEAVIRLQTLHWPDKIKHGKIGTYGLGREHGEYLNPDYPHEKEAKAKTQLLRLRGALDQLLQGDGKNRILNSLLERINPTFRPLDWKANPKFPYFASTDESVVLDLIHGQVYQKGGGVKPLPRNVREHADLRPFIDSQASILSFELEPNVFDFSSKQGEKMRVFSGENGKIVIHKQIRNRWAQKIAPFSSLPKPLKEKPGHWISVDQPKTLWIDDAIEAQVAGDRLKEVRRLDSGWVLGDPATPVSNLLHRIEDPDQILPWLQNGKIRAIELPRLSLTFDVDAEGNASTRLFDEYKISNKQTIPGLAHLNNYLVLEKKNKHLVLMPAYQREPKSGDLLVTDSAFKRNESAPLLVFDVNRQGMAVPKSTAARLYLSYLLLTEQRYDEAWNHLVGTDSELRSFEPLERKILGWMASEKRSELVQDPDPRAIALRLKAQLLLIRDQEHFQSSEKLKLSDAHYADLIQKMDQIPPRFLPTREEENRLERYFNESGRSQIVSRTKKGFLAPIYENRPEEEAKADQEAHRQLTQSDKAYALFGRPPSYEEDSKENKAKPKPDFFLRAGHWNDRGLILEAYECARHPTQERLTRIHRNFFPGNFSKSEKEMAKEIHESFALVARSSSHPFERAVSALICGVMDQPNDFPTLSEIKEGLADEARMRSGYGYGSRPIPFAQFADKALSAPIQRHCIQYLQRAQYPALEFIRPKQKNSTLSLWEAPETRLPTHDHHDVDLEHLFEVEQRFPYEKAHEELLETFSVNEKMVKELKSFVKSEKAQTKRHILKGEHLLTNLAKDSKRMAQAAKEQQEKVQREILALANRFDTDLIPRLKQVNDYLSDRQKPIEMHELFKSFVTLDAKALMERNSALDGKDCQVIFEKLQEFLIIATQRQHLMRLRKKCITALKAEGAEAERLIQEIAIEGGQKRAYAPHLHPEILLIEYGNRIRLRKNQIKAMEECQPGTAQEMIMGSGKTMVFLPLLALKAADGKQLSMIVMPQELLPSMAESLEKTFGKAFGRSIDVVEFRRDTHPDSTQLERIYERLENAIEKRRVVAMSGSGLQSLFLMAVDAFAKNKPEAVQYRKILALMKKSGNLILDEMHMLLDVLQAHHFSDGEKQPLSSIEMDGAIRLFQTLVAEGWNGTKPIAPENYQEQLKTRLVDQILKQPEFSRLSKEALKYYLMEENNPQAEIYVERIPTKSVRSLLATLKEQINRVLPLALGNEIGVHFGGIPEGAAHKGESRRTAIPYHGSQNPVLGSQFGSDLETINYTVIHHLVNGVDLEIVENEINSIKESVSRELEELKMRGIEEIDVQEAPSYQRFIALAGTHKKYPLFTLKKEEMEEIRQKINQSGKVKLELIHAWILPELRTYPRQLFTNGHIFPLLVSKIRGFSGTNWNSRTFPKAFSKIDTSDTQPYTLHLLQSQDAPLLVLQDPKALLQQSGNQSLADRGAVFRDMQNRDVARAMLLNSNAQGVVYYEGDKMKVVSRTQLDPIDYSACPYDKAELLAYWDEKHNTGSDIPLGAEARAVATVGRHTHLHEFLQCVWRMRGLHHGQRVRFAILEEEAAFIRAKLHRETGRPLNQALEARDLFLYCWLKEQNRGKEHSVRALGFKCISEFIEPVLEQLFDETKPLPPQEFFESLFYSEKGDDLFERYGRIASPVPKKEAVEIQVKNLLSKPILKAYPPEIQAKIERNIEKIADAELPHLPDHISLPIRDYEAEMEIETQQEQEQEKEVEKEVEVNREIDQFRADKYLMPRHVVSWKGTLSREDFLPSPAQALAELNLSKVEKWTVGVFREEKLTPVVSVADALYHFKMPLPLDRDLLASATFMPLQTDLPGSYPFTPFGKHQDIVQETLLIQDPHTGRIRMMLITQDEAKQFEKKLARDRSALENGVRLALYHIDSGLYAQGAGFPTQEILHRSPQFLKLKVQAKFFNGEVHYKEEEIPALENWIDELRRNQTLDAVQHTFEKEVLAWKERSRSNFPRSILYRMFRNRDKH